MNQGYRALFMLLCIIRSRTFALVGNRTIRSSKRDYFAYIDYQIV